MKSSNQIFIMFLKKLVHFIHLQLCNKIINYIFPPFFRNITEKTQEIF